MEEAKVALFEGRGGAGPAKTGGGSGGVSEGPRE